MASSSFAPGQAVRLAGLAKMVKLNGTLGLVLPSLRGDPPGTVKVKLRTGMEAVVKPANLELAPAEPAPLARPRSPPAARRKSPRRGIAPEQAQANLQRALSAAADEAARKLESQRQALSGDSLAASSTAPTPWLSALMNSQVGERPAPSVGDFVAGQTVKIVGLVKMAHMNGTRGIVLALGTGATGDIAGTVKVKLKTGSEVALKPENLEALFEEAQDALQQALALAAEASAKKSAGGSSVLPPSLPYPAPPSSAVPETAQSRWARWMDGGDAALLAPPLPPGAQPPPPV